MIENFMECYDSENLSEQLLLLEKHRKQLLSRVHKEEKHISCLDYLVIPKSIHRERMAMEIKGTVIQVNLCENSSAEAIKKLLKMGLQDRIVLS